MSNDGQGSPSPSLWERIGGEIEYACLERQRHSVAAKYADASARLVLLNAAMIAAKKAHEKNVRDWTALREQVKIVTDKCGL